MKILLEHKNQIPERLKELRDSRKWSKTYVANKIGKTLSTYANWEYGTREPDANTLIKLAKLYNVSVGYLLGTTENPIETTKEKILNNIEDVELRRFLSEIQTASVEDLDKLFKVWKIIKGEN